MRYTNAAIGDRPSFRLNFKLTYILLRYPHSKLVFDTAENLITPRDDNYL